MAANGNRKNIIFILSDQHNPKVLGYQGDEVVRTPNIDRLADNGTVISNCYCGSPLCVPSRTSMLTGKLPIRTGIFNNSQSLRYEEPTFVHSLTLAGYRTVLAGRMHFKGCDQRHGYAERLVGGISSPLVSYEIEGLGELEPGLHQNRSGLLHSGPGHSAILDYDREVTDASCDLLKTHDQTGEQPLFLTVGFFGPHCPFVSPPELFDYYLGRVPPPDLSEEFRKNVHPAVQEWYRLRNVTEVDDGLANRCRAAYYGCVEYIDGLVGRILTAIEESLGLDETIVIYGSDHGEMVGEKGLFWKNNFYEGSVRVPLVFRMAGSDAPQVADRPVSLIDLGPTLLELAGAESLPDIDGVSFMDLLTKGAEKREARPIISQLGDIKGDAPSAMVRYDRWKLISHHGYETPQLFDLLDDPEELRDLGSDPAHQATCAKLLKTLSHRWDASSVAHLVQSQKASIKLIKRWEKCVEAAFPTNEWWKGDPQRNFVRAT